MLARLPVAAIVVPLIAANLLGGAKAPFWHVAIGLLLVLVLAVIAAVAGLSRDDLGITREKAAAGLRWGAASAGVIAVGVALALLLPPVRTALAGAAGTSGRSALLAILVVIPLGTVLPEEFAFRGVLWAMIRRPDGPRVATAVSSGLFGLWHIVPALGGSAANQAASTSLGGGDSGVTLRVIGTVLVTALVGVVLCQLRIRSGSLLAPILAHWAINSVGVLLLLVA